MDKTISKKEIIDGIISDVGNYVNNEDSLNIFLEGLSPELLSIFALAPHDNIKNYEVQAILLGGSPKNEEIEY